MVEALFLGVDAESEKLFLNTERDDNGSTMKICKFLGHIYALSLGKADTTAK